MKISRCVVQPYRVINILFNNKFLLKYRWIIFLVLSIFLITFFNINYNEPLTELSQSRFFRNNAIHNFLIAATTALYLFVFRERKEAKQTLLLYHNSHHLFILMIIVYGFYIVSQIFEFPTNPYLNTVPTILLLYIYGIYLFLVYTVLRSLNYTHTISKSIRKNNRHIQSVIDLESLTNLRPRIIRVINFANKLALILLPLLIIFLTVNQNFILRIAMSALCVVWIVVSTYGLSLKIISKWQQKLLDTNLNYIILRLNNTMTDYINLYEKLDSSEQKKIDFKLYSHLNNAKALVFGSDDGNALNERRVILRNFDHFIEFYESLIQLTKFNSKVSMNDARNSINLLKFHFHLFPDFHLMNQIDESGYQKATMETYYENYIDSISNLHNFYLSQNIQEFYRHYEGFNEELIYNIEHSFVVEAQKDSLDYAIKIDVSILYNIVIEHADELPVEVTSHLINKFIFFKLIEERQNKNSNYENDFRKELLSQLIFCAIKSIETSNTKMAGYLIKIIVINFRTFAIKEVFEELFNMEPNIYRSYSLPIIGQKSMSLNGSSYPYCIIKTYFLTLIFTHQKDELYIDVRKNLDENIFNEELIDQVLQRIDESYSDFGLNNDMYKEFKKKIENKIDTKQFISNYELFKAFIESCFLK